MDVISALRQVTSKIKTYVDNKFSTLCDVDYVTPQMYGAAGDGSKDDTAAIQAAIDENKIIKIPAGTYLISSTLTIPADRYIYGVGDPRQGGASSIFYTTENICMIKFLNHRSSLENIELQHTTNNTSNIVELGGAHYIKLENVIFDHGSSPCEAIGINFNSSEGQWCGYIQLKNVTMSLYKHSLYGGCTLMRAENCIFNRAKDVNLYLTGEIYSFAACDITRSDANESTTVLEYTGQYEVSFEGCYLEGYTLSKAFNITNKLASVNINGSKIFYSTGASSIGTSTKIYEFTEQNKNQIKQIYNFGSGSHSSANIVKNCNFSNGLNCWKFNKGAYKILNSGLPENFESGLLITDDEYSNAGQTGYLRIKFYNSIGKLAKGSYTFGVWVKNGSDYVDGQADIDFVISNSIYSGNTYVDRVRKRIPFGEWTLWISTFEIPEEYCDIEWFVLLTIAGVKETYITGVSLYKGIYYETPYGGYYELAEKLDESIGYVTPQMYGAVGDGLTDDTVALQNCINYAATNKVSIKLASQSTYLIDSVTISSPICIDGQGATIKANTSNPMIVFNFFTYDPGKWSIIRDFTIDMNNISHQGLRIINTRNIKVSNMYFNNFNVSTATRDNPVYAIYEEGQQTDTVTYGYERYFDNIVFYPNIGTADWSKDYIPYITCVKSLSAGDDVWSNIVAHSAPNCFEMYNWTTMFTNIHCVGDSTFTYEKSTCFWFRSSGPYILNNIYMDSCPYAFKVGDNAPVICNNVNIVAVDPDNVGRKTKLFYLDSAGDRFALKNVTIRNLYSKLNTSRMCDYNSGAFYPSVHVINPEYFDNLENAGKYAYTPTFTDNFTGSITAHNNFDGTWSLRGNVKFTSDVTLTTGTAMDVFSLPVCTTLRNPVDVIACSGSVPSVFTKMSQNNKTGYVQLYDALKTNAFKSGDRIYIDMLISVNPNDTLS